MTDRSPKHTPFSLLHQKTYASMQEYSHTHTHKVVSQTRARARAHTHTHIHTHGRHALLAVQARSRQALAQANASCAQKASMQRVHNLFAQTVQQASTSTPLGDHKKRIASCVRRASLPRPQATRPRLTASSAGRGPSPTPWATARKATVLRALQAAFRPSSPPRLWIRASTVHSEAFPMLGPVCASNVNPGPSRLSQRPPPQTYAWTARGAPSRKRLAPARASSATPANMLTPTLRSAALPARWRHTRT